jgi:hypothetical protein
MGAALLLALAVAVAEARASERITVFVVEWDRMPPAGLSEEGEKAWGQGERLRERFLKALAKVNEVQVLTEASAAEARLEIREAAVHLGRAPATPEPKPPKPPRGGAGTNIVEGVDEVAAGRNLTAEYALVVRVSSGERFTDLSSSTRDTTASAAVDTVIRALKRWARERRSR